MSSFAEVRFETGYILYGTEGGAQFNTTTVTVKSGMESRIQNWQYARGKWDFGDRKLPDTELQEIINFFRSRKGRAQGFRFKDWGDYQDWGFGVLGSGVGDGTPGPFQMYKQYTSGTDIDSRLIRKPVASTIGVKQAGVALASNKWSLDATMGLITLISTASSVTAITVGGSTTLTLSTLPTGCVPGAKLYLTGFGGANAAVVNNIAHTVNSVSGAGPYTVVIATSTSGKTISAPGSAAIYAQASQSLSWTGEFDVPVRFDTDEIKYKFNSALPDGAGGATKKYFYIYPLPLVEIRV